MLDFEKELKKFKPIVDTNAIEEAVASEEITDVVDLIKMCLSDAKAMEYRAVQNVDEEF